MEAPTLQQVVTVASIIIFTLIIVYTVTNYRATNRILKQYGGYIRKTMELGEVKGFISAHKKIKIEVEDKGTMLKVYWIDKITKAQIAIELDKDTGRIISVNSEL